MRRSLPLLVLLLATAAACSRADNGTSHNQPGRPADQASNASASTGAEAANDVPSELTAPRGESDRGTGPDLDPAAAPGVAFDFHYNFRLAADRIADMQQQHQQLCLRYGTRCRVTGMDYRAANEEDVEATLSFLVDPDIASQFGRESVRAVTAADGELAESQIEGTDVGTGLKETHASLDDLRAELARIDARLAQRGLRGRERARLDEERQSIRAQIADLNTSANASERALAMTPIQFRYGSGAFAPASAHRRTLGEASANAAGTFVEGIRLVLIVFVTLSPWLLTALLIWGGFRLVRRRRTGGAAEG
jgi:hypothetical protein